MHLEAQPAEVEPQPVDQLWLTSYGHPIEVNRLGLDRSTCCGVLDETVD